MTAPGFCRPTEVFEESWTRSPMIAEYEQHTNELLAGYLGYLLTKGERSNPYIKEVIKFKKNRLLWNLQKSRGQVDKALDERSEVHVIVLDWSRVHSIDPRRSAHVYTVCHDEMGNGTVPWCKNSTVHGYHTLYWPHRSHMSTLLKTVKDIVRMLSILRLTGLRLLYFSRS